MRKNRISRLLISSALAATLVISSATIAFGCTGIYFGKDVTDNGTTLAGRSEDSGWTRYIKNYTVRQAETHEPGDMYVGASSGFYNAVSGEDLPLYFGQRLYRRRRRRNGPGRN